MRVLISAIACEPGQGSEAKVGWDAVTAIAKQHSCHVITHEIYRNSIDKAQKDGALPAVVFHYHGGHYSWHPNRWIARIQSWLIYRNWQRGLLKSARALHSQYNFDLAHHITYASWRIPSPLWRLPVPFVWGPIGGAGAMPWGFRHMLSASAALFELLRDISSISASRSRAFHDCVRRSTVVLAANEESRIFLEGFREQGDIQKLPVAYFSRDQLSALKYRPRLSSPNDKPLEIFAGGNLIGAKGLSIALRGIALAQERGVALRYTVAGGGPELKKLKALAKRLGIADVVLFHSGYRGAAYHERLRSSDIYLMPSFRDTTPVTLLEAIISECYPVVASTSAAGEIVRSVGGSAIPLTTAEDMAASICETLLWCNRKRTMMQEVAAEASKRVVNIFSEDAYSEGINAAYSEALKLNGRSSYI